MKLKTLVGGIALAMATAACSAGDMSGNSASFDNKGEITIISGEASIGKVGPTNGANLKTLVSVLGANVNETGGNMSRNTASFSNTGKLLTIGVLIAGANVSK